MLERPEILALQHLAYDGTPAEVCLNFKNQAYEALSTVIQQEAKNKNHERVEL